MTTSSPTVLLSSADIVAVDRALAQVEQAHAVLAEAAHALGAVAGSGVAEFLGYVSMERLVAHRSGCGNRSAVELLTVGRHLERFADTAKAVQAGEVSWAAVLVLARAAEGLTDAYRLDEAELLGIASSRPVEDLERVCRLWRARNDAEANATEATRTFQRRSVHAQFAFDGSCHGRFTLDPTGAETVWAALDTQPDPANTLPAPRTAAQRRADQFVAICQEHLGQTPQQSGCCHDRDTEPATTTTTDGGGGGGSRSTVDVVIDVETLAGVDGPLNRIRSELASGSPIAGPGLDRLLCDASYRALITDGPRVVLGYNRATPDIPPALRQAVRVRDRCCTFTGCDRSWQWCDLHHIIPRNRGGPTTADNLTLLCRFHHTVVHEGGWQLTRAPDNSIQITSP